MFVVLVRREGAQVHTKAMICAKFICKSQVLFAHHSPPRGHVPPSVFVTLPPVEEAAEAGSPRVGSNTLNTQPIITPFLHRERGVECRADLVWTLRQISCEGVTFQFWGGQHPESQQIFFS